jgi:FKBP-type peptidyl-prolyl cis-trans isomerase SlyD
MPSVDCRREGESCKAEDERLSPILMQIARDTVVSIAYTLSNDAGEVLDASERSEPLVYMHGRGQIIPGLEHALAGRSTGDSFQVRISPDDAYGEHDPDLVQQARRSQFGGETPEVGMRVEAEGPDGGETLTIVAIDGDVVTLDGNHPLAGVPLNFDVTVVEVRAATAQELAHGHVHGAGGHHH